MSMRRGVVPVLILMAAAPAAGCAPIPPSPPPTVVATASPRPTSTTAALLTKDDAEAVARRVPAPDALVWWINLGTNPGPLMGQGEFFIIDATDGHVVQHYDWIS